MMKLSHSSKPGAFWSTIARIILRNRLLFLFSIAVVTVLLGFQATKVQFSHTEARLLPDNHPVNVEYQQFLNLFGEEGNLIVLGIKDSLFFTPRVFNAWNQLSSRLQEYDEVGAVISISHLKTIEKDTLLTSFRLSPFITDSLAGDVEVAAYKNKLLYKLPIYNGWIYNEDRSVIRSAVYLKDSIVNTAVRKDFIVEKLIPEVRAFEDQTGVSVRMSGMPYIRTLNAISIAKEIEIFIGAALFITSLLFFFFFRSVRATIITVLTVVIGVVWCFGFLGLLDYEITLLTALIPPLIIVIGVANCVFLINKYQQEIKKHGNQAKSLQRVITKIGNAILLTNATTALGFATFIITQSQTLNEFGIVSAISIISIFLLCLLIIPIVYSYMPIPKNRHLKHLNKKWVTTIISLLVFTVKKHRFAVYITSIVLLCISIMGMYKIKVSGNILEDLPKTAQFFEDILFFESEFGGIVPMEILIDTRRKEGVMAGTTLRRMDELEQFIEEIPECSKPLSVVEIMKYVNQAFYNGNPDFYMLPSAQERNFILPYLQSSSQQVEFLQAYVDSTGQYARMTTFMKAADTERILRIEEDLKNEIEKLFPPDRYTVYVTGKTVLFQKGTGFLTKNLIISLSLAILMIALLMAWMFRNFKMILISLIPNILPLIITAGFMGFAGIPIKPSTILVFSIAFGISVDDTIHFLAKYRQELQVNQWKISRSVYGALRETGLSMFYTSVVLFFGFSVFMISGFGGTQALGGLVSATLLFAMLSNLILLPSLLISLEKSIANKKTFKKPALEILEEPDTEE